VLSSIVTLVHYEHAHLCHGANNEMRNSSCGLVAVLSAIVTMVHCVRLGHKYSEVVRYVISN
jgi:hypothetical protein